MLEVATGPGHVAMAFAAVCREVVGVDLTEAPLKIAERMRAERGLTNVSFQKGDVESRLPFKDGEFDVVVCRFAVHHFAAPEKVIAEMARVCRADGLVAIEDLIASEQPERAAYYNEFERLRDTSHTSALALSELMRMTGAAGLEIARFTSHGYRTPVVAVDQSGECVAGARGESDSDGRAGCGRRSERRTSDSNRRRAVFRLPDCDARDAQASQARDLRLSARDQCEDA